MNTNPAIELFEDALDKEKYVLDLYSLIIKELKDKETIKILNKINEDEIEHIQNVKSILALL